MGQATKDLVNSSAVKVGLAAVAIIAIVLIVVSSWDQISFQVRQVPGVSEGLKATVESQVDHYGESSRARLHPLFQNQGLKYPPEKIALAAIKSKKELQVYISTGDAPFQYVNSYPIVAMNPHAGPKLRAGDNQVPEGNYIVTLEPNTPYHLALRLNYPNEEDSARAKDDGRADPGSDITVHGATPSPSCISVPDQAIEDLFVMINDATTKPVTLVIAPVDFRSEMPPQPNHLDPPWLPVLYTEIGKELWIYPSPGVW